MTEKSEKKLRVIEIITNLLCMFAIMLAAGKLAGSISPLDKDLSPLPVYELNAFGELVNLVSGGHTQNMADTMNAVTTLVAVTKKQGAQIKMHNAYLRKLNDNLSNFDESRKNKDLLLFISVFILLCANLARIFLRKPDSADKDSS